MDWVVRCNPPVPESWWPTIRSEMPAFDPETTPAKFVGRIPETFRKFPGVLRSTHPIGRLYELDAKVLMLGVGYSTCTCLHLAEYRTRATKRFLAEGTAMNVGGAREWVEFSLQSLETDDFEAIGSEFEGRFGVSSGRIGLAEAKLVSMRSLVDFAVGWMDRNRV